MTAENIANDALHLITAERQLDHLGYLRAQRRIERTGSEPLVIAQLVGLVGRLLLYAFDCDDEDADAFLNSWLNEIHDGREKGND
jgi:hypothetical protein